MVIIPRKKVTLIQEDASREIIPSSPAIFEVVYAYCDFFVPESTVKSEGERFFIRVNADARTEEGIDETGGEKTRGRDETRKRRKESLCFFSGTRE